MRRRALAGVDCVTVRVSYKLNRTSQSLCRRMAKAELRHVAQGQASIVPPLSSRLLCRRLWRWQLPADTFRLVESNTLARWPSCVLRRRPTWVDRRVRLAEFRLRPPPALLDEPTEIIGHEVGPARTGGSCRILLPEIVVTVAGHAADSTRDRIGCS